MCLNKCYVLRDNHTRGEFLALQKRVKTANKEAFFMARKLEKRNGHAFHPIMKKGGVHEKSKGAKRAAAKHETNKKVREWLGRSSFKIPFLH